MFNINSQQTLNICYDRKIHAGMSQVNPSNRDLQKSLFIFVFMVTRRIKSSLKRFKEKIHLINWKRAQYHQQKNLLKFLKPVFEDLTTFCLKLFLNMPQTFCLWSKH